MTGAYQAGDTPFITHIMPPLLCPSPCICNGDFILVDGYGTHMAPT